MNKKKISELDSAQSISNNDLVELSQKTGDTTYSSKKTNLGSIADLAKNGLAQVATTGSYDDLTDKPTIPAAQVNSDWEAESGVAQILNKPTIPAAQVNSDWNAESGIAQILNKPTIPDAVVANDSSGTAGGELSSVKIDGTSYTIPSGGGGSIPTATFSGSLHSPVIDVGDPSQADSLTFTATPTYGHLLISDNTGNSYLATVTRLDIYDDNIEAVWLQYSTSIDLIQNLEVDLVSDLVFGATDFCEFEGTI